MKAETIQFSKSIIASLTKNEIKAINQFFDDKKFKPKLIDEDGIFHEKLREHPSIKWSLSHDVLSVCKFLHESGRFSINVLFL